jgi:hypothetical protein
MTDIEHRQCLIDADHISVFELFGERPRDATRPGGQIEHQLAAFECEHFDQLVRQRSTNARQPALIEFRGVRGIVKPGLVLLTMRVAVSVLMGVIILPTVLVIVMMVIVAEVRRM